MVFRLALAGLVFCTVVRAAEPSAITVGNAFPIAKSEKGNQRAPAVCALGEDSYLVVWQEGWPGAGGTCVIRGQYVKAGKPSEAFAVSPEKGVHESPAAAILKNGKALVVWQELVEGKQYDIRGRIFPLRAVSHAPPGSRDHSFTIASGAHNELRPTVASDGKNFLVAWQEYSNDEGRMTYRPACVRVSADGKVLGKPIKLSKSGGAPVACFNGQDFVVVYGKGKASYGKRVTTAGKLLDENGIKPSGLMGVLPAVASDGTDAMVVASAVPAPDPWGWGGPACVVAGRVTREGGNPERELNKKFGRDPIANGTIPNVLDHATWRGRKGWPAGAPGGFRGTNNGLWPTTPAAVAYLGGDFLAVWPRAHIVGTAGLANLDLYAVRVSRDPVKHLGDPVPVSTGSGGETSPALASAKKGECLLVYESVAEDGAVSIMARAIKLK